ncbi:AAA family ATPase [Pseudomonas sp. LP23]|uniref:AAA family ATPase n=1 Tax=Pseudomonas sp. LP23 TaxID=3029195 RepID=UPI0030C09A1B
MLIEFSVSNFRSFRERQTLSMVAAPRLGKKENVFKPKVAGENLPNLLKVAAIYGPNASGKSSLVMAMNIVSRILTMSPSDDDPLPVHPFRFDPALRDKPSEFEYNFISNGLRYQLQLAITPERIVHESLTAYPRGKETLYYSRNYTPGKGDVYEFGTTLEGGNVVHDAWRRLTGPKSLFLGQATANSSEDMTQLRFAVSWFREGSICIGQDGMSGWAVMSRSMIKKNEKYKTYLQTFLQDIDVPITDIRFEIKTKTPQEIGPDSHFTEHLRAVETDSRTVLTHTTALGEAEFDFSEESGGTQNLMGFWLPWTLIDGKSSEYLIVVDELNSSLHPKIVESLIQRHLETSSGAQLIFTTHDTHLMNTKRMRRDQFWLTERDANGATAMFSVHDFRGRDSEDMEKRYFEGRYRGLPILRRS